ncbi:hypothetical protein ACFV42_39915 [Streptomyces solisilvae]|uniref:hypothetical protein n=1 Tax=Streptomyces malaysiensis TaxID=92644 RepID=UPI0036762778
MKIGTGFHCGYFRWIGAGDFTGDGRADVYVTTADARTHSASGSTSVGSAPR